MTPLTAVLYVLTVARLTHLVTSDTILDKPRAWLTQPGDGWLRGKAGIVVECPYCASVYIAALVALAVWAGVSDWLLAIPAASYVTAWLETAVVAMEGEDG